MPKPEIHAIKKDLSQQKQPDPKQDNQQNGSVSQSVATEQTQSEQQEQPAESQQETATRFFQAVGIIEGEVSFNDQGEAKVALSGKTYPLLYIPGQKYRLLALQKRIKETDNPVKRLTVYPRVIHFPSKNKPQQIQFQLLKFQETTESKPGISQQLANMEFQVAGLWQFIPVCRVPCISVFKNATPERLEWIKQADAKSRVKFMKPAHLPVLWKEAPVKPFKYNPKAKQQEQPAFVKIKAKFLPNKDAFVFDSLLEAPTTEEIPKYVKVSKKDKQQAQQGPDQTESKQNAIQLSSEENPKKEESAKVSDQPDSLENAINYIAQQMRKQEFLNQNQGEQAAAIAQQLISHRVKDED